MGTSSSCPSESASSTSSEETKVPESVDKPVSAGGKIEPQKPQKPVDIMELLPKMPSSYAINLKHFQEKIPHFSDTVPDLQNYDSNSLKELLAKTEISPDILGSWQPWTGHFQSKEELAVPLTTVINYCENDPDAGDLKNKLRFVTKSLLSDKTLDAATILVLLACHGNVCNVQKRVGVDMAYNSLTNNLKDAMEQQSMKVLILRALEQLREHAVERLYYKINNTTTLNTHDLIGLRNSFCNEIGLPFIKDEHAGCNHKGTVVEFQEFYTVDIITDHIMKCLNHNPRKIPYDKTVTWFQENSPIGDSYEFLSVVFDESTGCVKKPWVQWMLHRLGILEPEALDKQQAKPEEKQQQDNKAEKAGKEEAKVPISELKEEKEKEGPILPPPPPLVRRVSDDLKMPRMVRAVSKEEEQKVLERQDSQNAKLDLEKAKEKAMAQNDEHAPPVVEGKQESPQKAINGEGKAKAKKNKGRHNRKKH